MIDFTEPVGLLMTAVIHSWPTAGISMAWCALCRRRRGGQLPGPVALHRGPDAAHPGTGGPDMYDLATESIYPRLLRK